LVFIGHFVKYIHWSTSLPPQPKKVTACRSASPGTGKNALTAPVCKSMFRSATFYSLFSIELIKNCRIEHLGTPAALVSREGIAKVIPPTSPPLTGFFNQSGVTP